MENEESGLNLYDMLFILHKMKLKGLQCKSCGTVMFVKESELKNPWCPLCRGNTYPVHTTAELDKLKGYKCPNCGYEFWMYKRESPYKCPQCNYTFPTTPNRDFDERL